MEAETMTKISKFDSAGYLNTPAAIAAYLTEVFEINDPAYIRIALDTVAREEGKDATGRADR
jgi:probable addiction module antidote protein